MIYLIACLIRYSTKICEGNDLQHSKLKFLYQQKQAVENLRNGSFIDNGCLCEHSN